MHRKACMDQLEKHAEMHAPWMLATKNLWSRAVAIPNCHEDTAFKIYDGAPHRHKAIDPLSTLVFATSMTLLMTDIICSKAPRIFLVAYVDDTVLLGPAKDVTKAIPESR